MCSNYLIFFPILLAALFGVYSQMKDSNSLIAKNLVNHQSPPDPATYETVSLIFENYQKEHPELYLQFKLDEANGVITSWFQAHKGEVRLKIEVGISGTYVRTEVWQDTGVLFSNYEKTVWARRFERTFAERIQDALCTPHSETNLTEILQ